MTEEYPSKGNKAIEAEESNPYTAQFPHEGVVRILRYDEMTDVTPPFTFEQLEFMRQLIRYEIAEAMKHLVNEPARKLVHEIEMYPPEDGM